MDYKNDNYIDGLVLIITPMYNSEKYIEETISSVVSQTYEDYAAWLNVFRRKAGRDVVSAKGIGKA